MDRISAAGSATVLEGAPLPLSRDDSAIALVAADLFRSVGRLLWQQGFAPLAEMPLADGRRADLMAVSASGRIAIVEIKISARDLMGDRKWEHYREYCDLFFWGVPPFLAGHLEQPQFGPAGVIVADRHDAHVQREAPLAALAPARRRAVTLALARAGAARAYRILDPRALPLEVGLGPRGDQSR